MLPFASTLILSTSVPALSITMSLPLTSPLNVSVTVSSGYVTCNCDALDDNVRIVKKVIAAVAVNTVVTLTFILKPTLGVITSLGR